MQVSSGFLARFGSVSLNSLDELTKFFSRTLGTDFPTWLNANVGGHGDWAGLRLSGGSAFVNFNSYWSALLTERPFSLLEMLAYTSATANETGGSFKPISENINRPTGPHPGVSYLFDSFVVHTPHGDFTKASYNAAPNKPAGLLFHDADFNAAHGAKTLGARLANTVDPVWKGTDYPKATFPTDGQDQSMGYILEADFYKFRGRGLIQTTWRRGYSPLVSFVQSYTGSQPTILAYKAKWAGKDPDLVCTISSTHDWDTLFQSTDLVVACAALLHHGEANHYIPLAHDAATVNGTVRGSLHYMGLRLRGDDAYGVLLQSRVAQVAAAIIKDASSTTAPRLASLLRADIGTAELGPASLPLAAAPDQPGLVRRMQEALGALGLLDPPVDGLWGPVSGWALRAFCGAAGVVWNGSLDAAILGTLEAAAAQGEDNALFPLRPKADFAGQVIAAMVAANHWVARHPECLNIVYVEGCGPDGVPNDNAPNRFNDARLLIRIDHTGAPVLVGAWEATTEPGQLYTVTPVDGVAGAARIAFGQFKAWQVGLHHGTMEALVQTAPIDIYRDLAKDYTREGPVSHGSFGINQHGGYDYPYGDIKNASAGCLVGRLMSGHAAFMQAVKTDVRYINRHGYQFMTTVLPNGFLKA